MMTLALSLLLQEERPDYLVGLRVGYDVAVVLKNGQIVEGRLTAVNDGSLSVRVEGVGVVHEPFGKIDNVVVTGTGDSKEPPKEEPAPKEKETPVKEAPKPVEARPDRALLAEGTVEFNGKRFAAATAIVQYWGESRWTYVRLYPVGLTAEEEKSILAGDLDGIVNGLAKRPGTDGFEAMPVLLIVLEHKEGARADAVDRVMFNTGGFEGAGSGTATKVVESGTYTLDGLKMPALEVGEPVEFGFKSEGRTSFDAWRIDVRVKSRFTTVSSP